MSVTTEIKVSGMHCDACVRRLAKALAALPDVTVKGVELGLVELVGADPPAKKRVTDAIVLAGFGLDD